MWFNILPAYFIITTCMALPGYALYGLHYLVLGNLGNGNTDTLDVSFRLVIFIVKLYKNMWYEILPSFFIITAGLGLPGWGLYHVHNLVNGNHFKRSLNDRWDRHLYQRDYRLTGNPYKINGLEAIDD